MVVFNPFQSKKLSAYHPFLEKFGTRQGGVELFDDYVSTLISGPECVFDLWVEGRQAALFVLIDVCENSRHSGELILFGYDPHFDPQGFPLAQCIQRARQISRARVSLLDFGLYPGSPFSAAQLIGLGFTKTYTTIEMGRRLPFDGAPTGLTDFGVRWELVDESNVAAFHALASECFKNNPETSVPRLEEFRIRTFQTPIRPHLLVSGNEMVAFTKVVPRTGGVGEIVSVGVAEKFRGQGLSRVLVAKALELLTAHGCTTVKLTVIESNVPAVALYRRFGFSEVSQSSIYSVPSGS